MENGIVMRARQNYTEHDWPFAWNGQPPAWSVCIRVFLIVCMAFLRISSAHSQATSFTPVAPDFLSNSFAKCFYKDHRGFMWIGTSDGLIRYDGTNVYRYAHNPTDKNTVAHSTINAIIEDRNNRLWIGTAQGLSVYNEELDNFVNVDSIKGTRNFLSNRYITDLNFDSNGRLWIGTHSGGINIYDPAKREYTYINDPPSGGILPSTNFG
jgi:ligand-binding sensor domain-containing protein